MIALGRPARCQPGGAPGEHGFVTLEFVLGLALLVLPVALIVLTMPTWFARQDVARLAAQEAARTAAVTESASHGTAMAREIAANNGLDPQRQMTVAFDPSSSYAPGGVVIADVTVRMPVTVIPGIGSLGAFSWTASYREAVDTYRSAP